MDFKRRMFHILPYVKEWVGIDGRKLNLGKLLEKQIIKKPMKRGVIGCFLSHLKIWKKIHTQNLGPVLIMEDDATWKRSFAFGLKRINVAMRYLNQTHPSWDILLLGRNPRRCENQKQITNNLAHSGQFWGLFSYIVSKKGAAKLAQIQGIEKACDVLVSDLGLKGELNIFAFTDEICTYIQKYKSDTFRIV